MEAPRGDRGCAGHQPKHTAILLWTKQALGRKRRNLEAFLEETAAELDCGSCLETVCGAGRGIRKAKARDGRRASQFGKGLGAAVWGEAGQSLALVPGLGVCRAGHPRRRGCILLVLGTGHVNGNQGQRERTLIDGHVCPQQNPEYLLDIFHLRRWLCTVIGSSKFTVSIRCVLCLWAVINRVLHYRSAY